jgi:hypothetical protein
LGQQNYKGFYGSDKGNKNKYQVLSSGKFLESSHLKDKEEDGRISLS